MEGQQSAGFYFNQRLQKLISSPSRRWRNSVSSPANKKICRLLATTVIHIVALTQMYGLHTTVFTLTLLHECWHQVCIALVL